ncbi:MAG: GxxExxY protein [bacterium]
MRKKVENLIYKDECYQIIGYCYKVYNSLGSGLKEKNYQKALEQLLGENRIAFRSQFYVPLKLNGTVVGKYFLDFLVDDKIAIELKTGGHILKQDIDQLYAYLKACNLKLGLLINFTSDGVKYKRIVNLI